MIEKIIVGRVVNFADLSAHRALAEKLNEVIEAVNGMTDPTPRHINTEPLSDQELLNHMATQMRNINHRLDITEE